MYHSPSPVSELFHPILLDNAVRLYLKRDDLIHPFISGNKWRKLKYNIQYAKEKEYDTIVSFGGAFSNHIYSLAAAGEAFNIQTVGILRGEEVDNQNPTLSFALSKGMILKKVSRTEFRNKETLENRFRAQYPKAYFIPEGGSNTLGVKGCTEVIEELSDQVDYDIVCCAVGTAGTVSGLINGLNGHKKILGFPVVKGGDFLKEEVTVFTNNAFHNWALVMDYHFNGYAKINKGLVQFIDAFYSHHTIQLEPIYTGKLLFGVFDLIEKGYFSKGSKIVAIHTGGLQGLEGMKRQMDRFRMQQ